LGGTNSGKSIVLPHCGKRAIIEGRKVVHYTLELDEQDIAERYDASFTGVNVRELKNSYTTVENRMGKYAHKYEDSLFIKYFPTGQATINTLRAHVNSLKNSGFHPDLIIVDYGDLLKPLTNYSDEYSDLGVIFKDLRGLAGEFNCPLWTASQVNRAGMDQETVDMTSVADSFKKMMIADIVIGMSATRDEAKNNVMRLFGAKNRNGPAKFEVKIRTAYERMCFYDMSSPITPPATIGPPTGPTSSATPPPTAPRRSPKVRI